MGVPVIELMPKSFSPFQNGVAIRVIRNGRKYIFVEIVDDCFAYLPHEVLIDNNSIPCSKKDIV
jgi:hypothetical protein